MRRRRGGRGRDPHQTAPCGGSALRVPLLAPLRPQRCFRARARPLIATINGTLTRRSAPDRTALGKRRSSWGPPGRGGLRRPFVPAATHCNASAVPPPYTHTHTLGCPGGRRCARRWGHQWGEWGRMAAWQCRGSAPRRGSGCAGGVRARPEGPGIAAEGQRGAQRGRGGHAGGKGSERGAGILMGRRRIRRVEAVPSHGGWGHAQRGGSTQGLFGPCPAGGGGGGARSSAHSARPHTAPPPGPAPPPAVSTAPPPRPGGGEEPTGGAPRPPLSLQPIGCNGLLLPSPSLRHWWEPPSVSAVAPPPSRWLRRWKLWGQRSVGPAPLRSAPLRSAPPRPQPRPAPRHRGPARPFPAARPRAAPRFFNPLFFLLLLLF